MALQALEIIRIGKTKKGWRNLNKSFKQHFGSSAPFGFFVVLARGNMKLN